VANMNLKHLARSLALIGLGAHVMSAAVAQQAPDAKVQRIEITGSSIKRVANQGALPVDVLNRDMLDKAGVTNAEQMLKLITSNSEGMTNLASGNAAAFNLGDDAKSATNFGSSNANLRGLGASATLVLLNGRRLPTYGGSGRAVDLNSIPIDAVQRIEVLKDGASAIYGTDAIGGVINFILKKDYQGLTVRSTVNVTEEGGGNIYTAGITGGFGNLDTQRFNVMASVSAAKTERLVANQRDFSSTGFQPQRGLTYDTTGAPIATLQAFNTATSALKPFRLPNDPQTYDFFNPMAWAGDCRAGGEGMQPYDTALWASPNRRFACSFDISQRLTMVTPNERVAVAGRATFALNEDHQFFVDVVGSKSMSQSFGYPVQLTAATYAYPAFRRNLQGEFIDAAGNPLPAGANPATQGGVRSPYYLDLTNVLGAQYFDNTRDIRIRWRCMACGDRQQEFETEAFRVLAGADGTIFGKWDYKLGASMGRSKTENSTVSGRMNAVLLSRAMGTGLINPFSLTQTPEALALIEDAKLNGKFATSNTRLLQTDGTLSGDLFKLPAGMLQGAVGYDARYESYEFSNQQISGTSGFTGFDNFPRVSRKIYAAFAELRVPILKTLEAQLAVRSDDYSDFGRTTNPKVALRFQPTDNLMFRASATTGFRAPDFRDLYTRPVNVNDPLQRKPVNTATNDPVLCPNPQAVGADPTVCNVKFEYYDGGNSQLKPEKSKQWSVGFAVAPLPGVNIGMDYYTIRREERVASIDPITILRNINTLGNLVVRKPLTDEDRARGYPVGQIDYIFSPLNNLASDEMRALDVELNATGQVFDGKWRANLVGTYVDSYRQKRFEGSPWIGYVGEFGAPDNSLHLRWKHNASVGYDFGSWSTTLSQNYWHHYRADNLSFPGTKPADAPTKVKPYILYNLGVTYSGIKNLKVTGVVNNLFNTDPPFAAINLDRLTSFGWDLRVGQPRGRSYGITASYEFF